MKNKDDSRLVAQALSDPEQGFRRLISRYKTDVYWHLRRLLVSHEDAQDALQETFIRVYRSLPTFKGDSSLRSWIYRIATNEALRLIDNRHGDTLSLDDSEEAQAVAATPYVDYTDLEAVRLQRAILSLPTKQQLVFNLRYYDELSYDEIALVAETTPAAAKANYHVAKDKIVAYIGAHE